MHALDRAGWEVTLASRLRAHQRDGNTVARDTLRMVLSALKNRRIELGRDLEDADVLSVLGSAVKSRQDSAEQYEQAGRTELAEKERGEIEVIQGYLPRQLDEAETRKIVGDLITELGVTSKKEMGKVMKAVMAKYKGEIDGKLVQRIAGESLE